MKHFKIFMIIIATLATAFQAVAQSLEDTKKVDIIKGEGDFIWGEGIGDTYGEARDLALKSLLSKIGLSVEFRFIQEDEENSVNGVINSNSKVSSVLNSYSNATISNSKSVDYKIKKGGYYSFIYLPRAEMEKMFSERMNQVEDFVRMADTAEKNRTVSDALKFLNYAYVMTLSLQHPGEAKMVLKGETLLLKNWIPTKMKDILDGVKVEVADFDEAQNSVNLFVTYRGEPAASADFTYFTGTKQSQLHSVKDGLAQITFDPDHSVQEELISFETSFVEASQCYPEVERLIANIKPLKFASANKEIGMEGKKIKAEKSAKSDFQTQVTASKNEGIAPIAKKDAKVLDKIIDEVLLSISNKSFKPNPDLFTPEGLDMFEKLLNYGKATILGKPDLGYYPLGDRVVARSVPMKFDFKNNRRSFVEDVTFTFSPEKKIESIAFGLGSTARRDIFNQGAGVWSDDIMMVIANFLENYKTAFALKRLDYINSIFDEDAYIIVGHKLEPAKKINGDVNGLSFLPKYEYAKKSKQEYIAQLKKCFASNEFVNINFSDTDIQKAAMGGDTFGIQIKQDYYSQHYGDQGYLFLFVDLNEPDQPIIKIRTWQPERNPDLTPTLSKASRDYGIYGNHLLR